MIHYANAYNKFNFRNFPIWECPHCGRGQIEVDRSKLTLQELSYTSTFTTRKSFVNVCDTWHFSAKMECNWVHCKKYVMVSGVCKSSSDQDDIEEIDTDSLIDELMFTPRYFTSPIKFFRGDYPLPIDLLLESAFALYWTDVPSAANKIRAVIEKVLDLRKVKKFARSKGKQRTIALHHRIVEFKQKNQEVGHFFEAVKWIGNSGSHADDKKINRDDLLQAFEILEHSLNTLYNHNSKKLTKIASAIIKSKGPVKKNTLQKQLRGY